MVKKEPSFCRRGTIMIRKKGNANENLEDLTAHRTASAMIWAKVNKCIFHVGTRRTNGSEGWYLTGIRKRRNLQLDKRPIIILSPTPHCPSTYLSKN